MSERPRGQTMQSEVGRWLRMETGERQEGTKGRGELWGLSLVSSPKVRPATGT